MIPNTKLIHSFTTFMGPRRIETVVDGRGYWTGKRVEYIDNRRLIYLCWPAKKYGVLYEHDGPYEVAYDHYLDGPWSPFRNLFKIGGVTFEGHPKFIQRAKKAFTAMYPNMSWTRYGVFSYRDWKEVATRIKLNEPDLMIPQQDGSTND